RDQLAAELIDRADVEAEAREAVLADGGETVVNLDQGRRNVRLADIAGEDGDQCVRLVDAGGQHAARPVVFERAAEERHPVRQKRRGERVAGMARIGLAVEGEADGAGAVDAAARRGAARTHAFSPLLWRIADLRSSCSRAKPMELMTWVSVLRTTTRWLRQPPECCQCS